MKRGPKPFTSHVKMMVLTLTLPHAGRWFYQREIQMISGIAYTPVRAGLLDLEAFGLLIKRTHGNRQYYVIDKNFFLYPEYKSIVLKTTGLGDHLRYRMKKPSDMELAFVYGDFAEGTETTETPIRVCVVGDLPKRLFDEALAKASVFTQKQYKGTCLTPKAFLARCKAGGEEWSAIMRGPKLFLWGTAETLRDIGKIS